MKISSLIRNIFLVAIALAIAFAYIIQLMSIQIVDGDYYASQTTQLLEATQSVQASRGQISDINGNILTTNKIVYKVIIQKAFFPSGSENQIISRIVKIMQANNEEWIDNIPISMTAPFTFKTGVTDEKLDAFKQAIGVNVDATVQNCLDALAQTYKLDKEKYDSQMQRAILGVRYEMTSKDFSYNNRYVFAEDVNLKTVTALKEQSIMLAGTDIVEEPVRVYERSTTAPHILGTYESISDVEYEERKDSGYTLNDQIGKFGIELAMEEALRGENGIRTIVRDSNGNAVSDEITDSVEPGNSVKLTIDADFQDDLQEILKNQIAWLHYNNDPNRGNNCPAGAAVVLDAKTGAVLAMASYPTYDLNDYVDDYFSVLNADDTPLLNRAINGLYRPGSAFKTINAIAGLSEGIINRDTPGICTGRYTFYDDYQPGCTGYHYGYNVVDSLYVSCNIFFYDLGRRLGIDTLSKYATAFGYGTDLGLGIGESQGRFITPEVYEKITGITWTPGNVLQASIGQSETQVTPLNLAVQAMTLANNGVRYKPYLVDSVWNYDFTEQLSKTEPVVAATIDDNGSNAFSIVREGMIKVSTWCTWPSGSNLWTFDYLPHAIAIKTGTAESDSSYSTFTSTVMGYYPADDPQIAFGIILEKGEYSRYMIRNIIDAYFYDCYEPDVDADGNIVSPWKRWDGEKTPVR